MALSSFLLNSWRIVDGKIKWNRLRYIQTFPFWILWEKQLRNTLRIPQSEFPYKMSWITYYVVNTYLTKTNYCEQPGDNFALNKKFTITKKIKPRAFKLFRSTSLRRYNKISTNFTLHQDASWNSKAALWCHRVKLVRNKL